MRDGHIRIEACIYFVLNVIRITFPRFLRRVGLILANLRSALLKPYFFFWLCLWFLLITIVIVLTVALLMSTRIHPVCTQHRQLLYVTVAFPPRNSVALSK